MNLKDALNLFESSEFKFKLNNRAAWQLQGYLNRHILNWFECFVNK